MSEFEKCAYNVFNSDNQFKVFECNMKDGSEMILQAHVDFKNGVSVYGAYNFKDVGDLRCYHFTDVESFKELEYKVDTGEDDEGSMYSEVDEETLSKYEVSNSLFKYTNLEDFLDIVKALNYPISDNLEVSWDESCTPKYETGKLKYSYGLLYYWSHMGNFDDCPTGYFAVIDGGRVDE